ncbi:hypothetical protein ScPMuIL_017150 [Solemya velum]
MLDELRMNHVHIKDTERVQEILTNMMMDGPNKLQIVADFDRTLSKFTEKGVMCASCHNVLEEGHVLPELYKDKTMLKQVAIHMEIISPTQKLIQLNICVVLVMWYGLNF